MKSRRSWPKNRRSPTRNVGTPKAPRAIAKSVFSRSADLMSSRSISEKSPIQAANSRPDLKRGGIGNGRCQGACRNRSDAGDGLKPPAGLVRAVPGMDALLSRRDLVVQRHVLPRQRFQAGAGDRRQAVIMRIGDHRQQFFHPWDADRRDDAELGHVGTDRGDQHGSLTDQQLPGPVQHQNALLLRPLHRDEAHGRPRHRLADGCRVRRVVLVPLHIRLHVVRRHSLTS